MLNRCLTPGCTNFAPLYDVLCTTCRQQSNNTAVSVAYFPAVADYHITPAAPDLAGDLAALSGWLVADQHESKTVIHRQQLKLDLRARIIQRRTAERDAERARADGLEAQIAGLRMQITALQAELDQLYDLPRQNGDGKPIWLAVVDTAPGDYSPLNAGYNVIYERIDPVSLRAVYTRWYRVE